MSALQVRSARTRIPDEEPNGPIAVVKGVVGGHCAYNLVGVVRYNESILGKGTGWLEWGVGEKGVCLFERTSPTNFL